jgi:hypothetical protein
MRLVQVQVLRVREFDSRPLLVSLLPFSTVVVCSHRNRGLPGFDSQNGGRSRSSVGRSSASHAEGPGFDPLRELLLLASRKVERSIRPENSF